MPIVFAVLGDRVYSVVDAKPKRTRALRRLANVRENPAVALLVDHYDDADWSSLWWVRAEGQARVLGPDELEARRAIALLRAPISPAAGDRGGAGGGCRALERVERGALGRRRYSRRSVPLVVITGATRGIGRSAAVELARSGAEVAVVGRDPDAFTRSRVEPSRRRATVHEHART